jgi:hypothetical protein
VNDDPAPTIAIDDITVAEGANLSFTVTRTGATDVPITFNWANLGFWSSSD